MHALNIKRTDVQYYSRGLLHHISTLPLNLLYGEVVGSRRAYIQKKHFFLRI